MTEQTRPKSAARAYAIHDHLNAAFKALSDARFELRTAGDLAATDYPLNDLPIRTAEAGADLTLGAVIRELNVWTSYANARGPREGGA